MDPAAVAAVAIVGVALALLVGLVARLVRAGRRTGIGAATEWLCDRCTLNDPRYCDRPERPHAKRCPDYRGP